MKLHKKIKKYHILFSIATLLSLFTLFFFFSNIHLKNLFNEKPSDVVVANISTIEAQIYWKTGIDEINTISFKKSSDTGLFSEIEGFSSYTDSISKERINVVQLGDLEPNTEYTFRIESEKKMWDSYTFKTKDIAEEVFLPNIVTGKDNDQSFVLVDIEGDKYMLNTQYHGTWAFDSQNKEYDVSTYANYISETELQSRLLNLLGSPVYAQAGANCKTNVKINTGSTTPSKATVVDILNRWVSSCKLGGYPDECYEDIYCRALKAGVNPAFAITIWSNESGGSNYANNSQVEDFGIHGLSSVPVANFDKQADHFLNNIASNSSSYISGCTGGNQMYSWGAKFLTGGCTSASSLDSGQKYMTGISEVYSWYTNTPLTWPFTISASSSCDYSSSTTNTTYNSCSAKGTPTSAPSDTPGSTGTRDYMIVSGTGVTAKDRNCKDPDGCICLYGYSNSRASATLNIDNGYTCTVDQKVVKTSATAASTSTTTDKPAKKSDGIKDYMIVSGTGVTAKDRACIDPDGCICLYGYSNSRASATLTIKYGYTCTVDKKVILTPEKICCYSNNSLTFVASTSCTGTILEGIAQENCKSSNKTLSIKRGIDFIEASYVVNKEQVPISTARSLLTYSSGKILAIGLFRNDRWEKIIKSENGTISGQDFNLEPGESYLVVSTEDIDIPIVTVKVDKILELDKLTGWNLIPSSLFTNVSSNSKSILQNTEYTYINQIALWNDEISIFDYTLRDNSGTIYGDSLSVLDQEGFFVKIPQ